MAVALAGPYASLHLAPDRQTTPAPHHSVFTGRMPFLMPNQQRQSTEGSTSEIIIPKAPSVAKSTDLPCRSEFVRRGVSEAVVWWVGRGSRHGYNAQVGSCVYKRQRYTTERLRNAEKSGAKRWHVLRAR